MRRRHVHHTRYDDAQLRAKFRSATKVYDRQWAHIDDMIRGIVAGSGNRSFVDGHRKVVLIDGIYRTQISRAIAKDADQEVTSALMTGEARSAIRDTAKIGRLDAKTIGVVLGAHASLVALLKEAFPNKEESTGLRSFASKYLLFHAQYTPIFDSFADETMPKYEDRKPMTTAVAHLSETWPLTTNMDRQYRWFALRFLALRDHLDLLAEKTTIKYVDQMLWSEQPNT